MLTYVAASAVDVHILALVAAIRGHDVLRTALLHTQKLCQDAVCHRLQSGHPHPITMLPRPPRLVSNRIRPSDLLPIQALQK